MVMEVQDMETIRSGDVLVDFYTSTCGPCKMMNPVLDEISEQFSNLKVAKIEVTKNPEASRMFGVMSVPTLIFLRDSKVREVSRGFLDKNKLVAFVKKNLNGHAKE